MQNRFLANPLQLSILLYAVLCSSPLSAQQEAVEVSVTHRTDLGPYYYALRVSANQEAEVLQDRRIVELEFRSTGKRRRRYRCKHPKRPSPGSSRVRSMTSGETWEEWFDIRMYCSAKTLKAMQSAETVKVRYGWKRRSRRRYIAKIKGRRSHHAYRAQTSLIVPPPKAITATTPEVKSPVRVSARTARGSRGRASIRVRLNGEGSQTVYPRDDLWWFRVTSPMFGEVICKPHRQPIAPIVDFYRRISKRRSVRETLDSDRYCEEGTFPAPGLYEITPVIDLIYDGEAVGKKNVVTGTFEGQPVAVRIPSRRYVAQPLSQLEEALKD